MSLRLPSRENYSSGLVLLFRGETRGHVAVCPARVSSSEIPWQVQVTK
jgi:hypothetical protein